MDLLEREGALATLSAALDDSAAGSGRVVVVAGEAGIGKTALVAAAMAAAGDRRRILTGACDPLLTPRALGPFHDIARQGGGALAAAFRDPGGREEVVGLVDRADQATGEGLLGGQDVGGVDPFQSLLDAKIRKLSNCRPTQRRRRSAPNWSSISFPIDAVP